MAILITDANVKQQNPFLQCYSKLFANNIMWTGDLTSHRKAATMSLRSHFTQEGELEISLHTGGRAWDLGRAYDAFAWLCTPATG